MAFAEFARRAGMTEIRSPLNPCDGMFTRLPAS
jgi:hypothetical protein